MSPYCRHHSLLDWTGNGAEEMLVSHNGAMYNHKGERIATFTTPGEEPTAKARGAC